MKIYQIYDKYKIILETADQLGRLEKEEIYEILKLMINESNSKKEENAKSKQEIIDKSKQNKRNTK